MTNQTVDNLWPFANPIFIKSARSRLRLGPTVAWGVVVLVLASFLFLGIYLTATRRDLLPASEAAKATIPALIAIQALILMLIGTGSVASGLAQERDSGVLDYLRMSPMTPLGKIIGYLYGMPSREYFLFLLTVPFMLFAIIVGEVAWSKVLRAIPRAVWHWNCAKTGALWPTRRLPRTTRRMNDTAWAADWPAL